MEVLFLIVLPLFLLSLLVSLVHPHKTSKTHDIHPPGPPGLPFIGNFHQLLNMSRLHEELWQLSLQYGPLMSMKVGSIPTLVVSSSRLAEEVLKTQDLIFCSRPKLIGQQKLSYNGLDIAFAPYSQEWRETRKICVLHLLSAKRILQYRPIREDEASRMLGKIRKHVELGGGTVTNFSAMMVSVTSTMICRIAFGTRLDEESHEKRKLDDLLHEVQAMFMGFFFTDYFPRLGWIDKLTGMQSRLDTVFEKFDSFYQKLIDEHLDYPNRPMSMDDDIIDLMLQLQRDRSTSFELTVDHIKAMLMNIFLAGTDTTTVTLIWAMTALMKNPNVMKKLQTEIRQVMGKKEILDEDDIEKLPYLKATVKETLRMFPTEPLLLPRETLQKCNLAGYEIMPKTLVYVNAWGIARDPKVWENPDEFFPERFLNSRIDLKGQDFQVIPFGWGRRGCPGYSMGLSIVHLLLANLLHSFDWNLPFGMVKEDIDTESFPGLAMFKKTDLKLVPQIPATKIN